MTPTASGRGRCSRPVSASTTGRSAMVTSSAIATGTTITLSTATSHSATATAPAIASSRQDHAAADRTAGVTVFATRPG